MPVGERGLRSLLHFDNIAATGPIYEMSGGVSKLVVLKRYGKRGQISVYHFATIALDGSGKVARFCISARSFIMSTIHAMVLA